MKSKKELYKKSLLKKIIRQKVEECLSPILEAVIFPVDFSVYINDLKEYVENNNNPILEDVNKIFEPANVIFSDYDTAKKNIESKEEREKFPEKNTAERLANGSYGIAFALYNKYINKTNVVIVPNVFLKQLSNNIFGTCNFIKWSVKPTHQNVGGI